MMIHIAHASLQPQKLQRSWNSRSRICSRETKRRSQSPDSAEILQPAEKVYRGGAGCLHGKSRNKNSDRLRETRETGIRGDNRGTHTPLKLSTTTQGSDLRKWGHPRHTPRGEPGKHDEENRRTPRLTEETTTVIHWDAPFRFRLLSRSPWSTASAYTDTAGKEEEHEDDGASEAPKRGLNPGLVSYRSLVVGSYIEYYWFFRIHPHRVRNNRNSLITEFSKNKKYIFFSKLLPLVTKFWRIFFGEGGDRNYTVILILFIISHFHKKGNNYFA